MNEMEEARLEIAETRAHLSETAEQLGAALSEKADAVKQRVSPAHYAREYPWAALGLAVGVGLAIGLSGADRKAAAGIAAGAGAVKDKIADRMSSDEAETVEPPGEPGIREKIGGQIDQMLADGLREFMGSLGEGGNASTRTKTGTSTAATRTDSVNG
jgi:hypothetical protein